MHPCTRAPTRRPAWKAGPAARCPQEGAGTATGPARAPPVPARLPGSCPRRHFLPGVEAPRGPPRPQMAGQRGSPPLQGDSGGLAGPTDPVPAAPVHPVPGEAPGQRGAGVTAPPRGTPRAKSRRPLGLPRGHSHLRQKHAGFAGGGPGFKSHRNPHHLVEALRLRPPLEGLEGQPPGPCPAGISDSQINQAPTAGPGHSMSRGSCQALHLFPQSRDTSWAHLTDEGTEAPRGERPHSCSARPRNKNRGAAPRPRVRGPCSPPPSSSKREGGPVPLSPSLSPPREAGVQRPRLRKLGGPIS